MQLCDGTADVVVPAQSCLWNVLHVLDWQSHSIHTIERSCTVWLVHAEVFFQAV